MERDPFGRSPRSAFARIAVCELCTNAAVEKGTDDYMPGDPRDRPSARVDRFHRGRASSGLDGDIDASTIEA